MREKLRIGILDFYNLQKAQRNTVVFSAYKPTNPRALKMLTISIKKLGHKPVIYYPEHCQLFFDNKNSSILYKGKKIKGCDVLIPRFNMVQNVALELSVVKQFELMGIPVLNTYLPIARAMNKLHTFQLLTQAKIPVPRTIVVRNLEYMDEAIEKVGGYPVIIKSPFGSQGKGVSIIESRRSMYSALDIIWKAGRSPILLIQEYVAEAYGRDYRAYVVGNRVIAAMERKAAKGDFRSNIHLGGEANPIELTDQEKNIAIRATKVLGLDSCGVDLLRTMKGPVVMEMNACAGITGISAATGIDISRYLIEHAIKMIKDSKISKKV